MKLLNGFILTTKVVEDAKDARFIINKDKAYKELVIKFTPEHLQEYVGKTVYVMNKSGTEVEIKEEKYVAIHERDIMLIL